MHRPGYNSTPTDSSHKPQPQPIHPIEPQSSSSATSTSTSPSTSRARLPLNKPTSHAPLKTSSSFLSRTLDQLFFGMMRESKHAGGPGGLRAGGGEADEDLTNNGKTKGGMFGREGTWFGQFTQLSLIGSEATVTLVSWREGPCAGDEARAAVGSSGREEEGGRGAASCCHRTLASAPTGHRHGRDQLADAQICTSEL